MWFLRYASEQTDKQTHRHTYRHADRNTSHPFRGVVSFCITPVITCMVGVPANTVSVKKYASIDNYLHRSWLEHPPNTKYANMFKYVEFID